VVLDDPDVVKKYEICGSYRRKCMFIGDLDVVVVPVDIPQLRNGFDSLGRWLSGGDRAVSIELPSGLQCDLLLSSPVSFGAAVLHFTGSKFFNIKCRFIAKELGFKLNQYGLWTGNVLEASEEDVILEILGLLQFRRPDTRSL
jgi:DNA polymerase (family 10)